MWGLGVLIKEKAGKSGVSRIKVCYITNSLS